MSGPDVALAVLAVAFLGALLRVVVGPTVADRAVGADVAFYVVIAGLALLSVSLGSSVFLDAVVVATLLGFVASLALARLILARTRDRSGRGGRAGGEDDR